MTMKRIRYLQRTYIGRFYVVRSLYIHNVRNKSTSNTYLVLHLVYVQSILPLQYVSVNIFPYPVQ